jgi:tetratricopeptide (TPR) repeat protein
LLINYYESRKDYQEVIKLYEGATTYDPNNVEVYVGLVKAYYNVGRVNDAINLAEELVKAEPSLKEELQPWLK